MTELSRRKKWARDNFFLFGSFGELCRQLRWIEELEAFAECCLGVCIRVVTGVKKVHELNSRQEYAIGSDTHTHKFSSPKCSEILIYDYDFMVNLLTLFLFRYIYKLHNKAMHSCVAFVWGRGKKNLKFAFVSGFFNEQFRQKWQWIHLMWIEMTIDIVQSFMCCVLLLAILVSFPNKNIKQAKAYQKAKIGQSRKRERKLDRNQFIFSINIYVST